MQKFNPPLKKRTDIHTILLIGSGPIVIGQACEFDYSGTQAVKTLKSLGYKVVLINSNPATIMTDPDFADRTYIEPITEEVIADIIKKEKVDAILPTMGGQTALNVAMSMFERGMLEGIEFLGAKPQSIKKGEDRQAFKEAMLKIGMDLPQSRYAYTEEEALIAAKEIGFPLIIRASYTLAGGGSGVAYNIDEFKILVKNGLEVSPIGEILIEESLLGWKEFEMEVIRDKNDNCIIVCSIENLDPMGVHTGDSITIAPALTLTDKEYQRMRDASFKILREIGVDTGGSNVQFAINPKNGRMTVIEMNPRVSRSSALASKATGYPIAKVATMLAVGFSLDEIKNDITGTPASFEPSIDYIVTKIPRFTFEKFPKADSTLTTSMKSIGEVMAMGGTFKESLQKAMCSLEMGIFGFNRISQDLDTIKKEIRRPNANRLLYIAEGFGLGMSIDEVYELSKIDRWFLNEIREIIESENDITAEILNNPYLMRKIKSYGFSDKMIAYWLKENDNLELSESEVYQTRLNLGVKASYCEVDTCAAEFPSLTSYLYSTIGDYESLEYAACSDFVASDSHTSLQDMSYAPPYSTLHSSDKAHTLDSLMIESSPTQNRDSLYEDKAILKPQGNANEKCKPQGQLQESYPENQAQTKDTDSSTMRQPQAAVSLGERETQSHNEGTQTLATIQSERLSQSTQGTMPPGKVLIIGGGPNRIGQGIEFDYCCVHASFALKDLGVQSIMYNCNPETVSTDYDISDILYFEPIDFERVRAVIEREKPQGIIVHFGGQTPLKLAHSLNKINAKIIGTSVKAIDIAEDREKFAKFVSKLGLNQPQNGIAFEKEQAFAIANRIGFPVLVRPSYVLGGRAMRIVYDDSELKHYMDEVIAVSDSAPVLIDKFLEQATEFDVDCISDGRDVYIGGIMEHIEEAGIHSGDSASSLPAVNVSAQMLDEIIDTTAKIALKLDVVGLMNVQYAIFEDQLYLIEVNPRASRTVPFVSKATGIPLAKIATRVMWHHSIAQRAAQPTSSHLKAHHSAQGESIEKTMGQVQHAEYSLDTSADSHQAYSSSHMFPASCNESKGILEEALSFYDKYDVIRKHKSLSLENNEATSVIYKSKNADYCSIKESVFPFNKLPGADLTLGPEMKSTGEVMGIGKTFGIAFGKSQLACKNALPEKGRIFISLRNSDKKYAVILAQGFIDLGFEIVATSGTHRVLGEANIPSQSVLKVSEGRPHINDMIANREIAMVVNTSSNKAKLDEKLIREAVLCANIPYFTTISGAKSAIIAMQGNVKAEQKTNTKLDDSNIHITDTTRALQDYLSLGS